MSDEDEVVQEWRVIDRWWTDEPIEQWYRKFASGRIERHDGDEQWKEWTE